MSHSIHMLSIQIDTKSLKLVSHHKLNNIKLSFFASHTKWSYRHFHNLFLLSVYSRHFQVMSFVRFSKAVANFQTSFHPLCCCCFRSRVSLHVRFRIFCQDSGTTLRVQRRAAGRKKRSRIEACKMSSITNTRFDVFK